MSSLNTGLPPKAAGQSPRAAGTSPAADRTAGHPRAEDSRQRLLQAIEHATHLLPSQGPISVFVHHNTLHAFEDLPFEQAVIAGSEVYDSQPYLSEDRYRQLLNSGRIRVEDLECVLADDLGDSADTLVASFGTRYALRLAMLEFPIRTAPDMELQWLIAETDAQDRFCEGVDPRFRERLIRDTKHWVLRDLQAGESEPDGENCRILQELLSEQGRNVESWSEKRWESLVLRFLWRVCSEGVLQGTTFRRPEVFPRAAGTDSHQPWLRQRDILLEATGTDSDRMVNEILIRFCAAFLDQGFADWELPYREQGFLRSFAELHACPASPVAPWLRPLRTQMRQLLQQPVSAIESIEDSLKLLQVEEVNQEAYVRESLLALRGWAGLIWQMETSAPWTPRPAPKGTLLEYLAVRLILERNAVCWLAKERLGVAELGELRQAASKVIRPPTGESQAQLAFSVFQLAQLRGWSPRELEHLTGEQWQQLIKEIQAFPAMERRRVFHLAYERKYRQAALDAVLLHNQPAPSAGAEAPAASIPAYQVVCCIDDREESFRRHLEECDPECETFGAAGFFAVAMYYQGAAEAHYRPLCPIVITPQHYVREEPVFSATDVSERRSQRRRMVGQMTHQVHARSRTLLGGAVTGVLGSLATFPLVARILAPRLTARMRSLVGTIVQPPATELHIERVAKQAGPEDDALGYSVQEMGSIVVRILQDIGLVKDFSPLILFMGHGSSSMNNPHESAYNCGACSGGRGGPNARAFAHMANDPRVRELTKQAGIEIPVQVRFLGAYHNTCNDRVEYYDLDQLPRSHRELFRRVEASINDARARNAHERTRRFESAPLGMSPSQALQHVEERTEDLSQARPEYNHATNAMCVVGRRSWSRGLFLDRRSFLTSYDPAIDDANASILARILGAAIPVCAGISLEYYFSTVDNEAYGSGSKLPHNISALVGVMTGAASDSRPGLSAQMVEIHEPLRILFIIETSVDRMTKIMQDSEIIGRLVRGGWVQLALYDAHQNTMTRFVDGQFVPHVLASDSLPRAESSWEWYRGCASTWNSPRSFLVRRRVSRRLKPVLEQIFTLCGVIVVGAPALLVVMLGLTTLIGRPLSESVTARLTSVSVVVGLLASLMILGLMLATDQRNVPIELGDWISIPAEHFHFKIKLVFDRLSVPFTILSFVLCGVVGAFTRRYLHREEGYNRFFLCYAFFVAGMTISSVAGTIETLFFGWELVGLSSAMLIAYFHERERPVSSGQRVWSVYRLADAAFLIAALTLHKLTGEGDFALLIGQGDWPQGVANIDAYPALIVGCLLLIAAAGKSGLVPFSGWLPRAMEGPTPSSAVFYGSLSVHLGAYLLLRVSPILDASMLLRCLVISVGLLSAICGSLMSRVQTDVKNSLAYASLTQVGIIVVEIGFGLRYLALIHIVGHACLRTLQLLRAPSLLKDYHNLENAIGSRLSHEPSVLVNSLPRQLRMWFYRLGYERGFLDTLLDNWIVHPFVRVFQWSDSMERRWTDWISREPSRESDQAERHPEELPAGKTGSAA